MVCNRMQRFKQVRGLLLILALGVGGCSSGLYPVQGKVKYSDGEDAKELAGGLVEFESVEGKNSARGEIRPDGSFEMTTERPGDGVWAGKHKVVVSGKMPEPDKPRPPRVIDPRFEKYETSGLEVTVEPKKNQITLTVDRAATRNRAR